MKLAKEKVNLTWLRKPEYEVLTPLWQEDYRRDLYYTYEKNCYGFRRTHHRDKGRGTTTQHIRLIVRQTDQKLQVDIYNPNTGCASTAVLPLDDLPPSPRQFQKLIFREARGDANTLSAGKTNLREAWAEFLEAVEKMPVVEHEELHIDNSDEGWLE
jgi:hypothetical protein